MKTTPEQLKRLANEQHAEITHLREENTRLREAFKKAANDMHPMLRSMISRDQAAEIIKCAAAAALKETENE